jgi:hypothetical protein
MVVSLIAGLNVWGFIRLHRARAAIRDALQANGFELVELKRRWFRVGPFSWTTSGGGRLIYSLTVRDGANHLRTGWARWGGIWWPGTETPEFRWDE